MHINVYVCANGNVQWMDKRDETDARTDERTDERTKQKMKENEKKKMGIEKENDA